MREPAMKIKLAAILAATLLMTAYGVEQLPEFITAAVISAMIAHQAAGNSIA